MTNDRAIEVLKAWDLNYQDEFTAHEFDEAFRMAIKALEQQSEGAISRQAAIDIVQYECGEWKGLAKEIVKQFNGLPSIQPKQIECEDAISREDALKALAYDIESFEFKSGVSRHMNEIANLLNTIYEIQSDNIKALPPVQPMPKMGHWVEYTRVLIPEPINRWEQAWYCSECGYGNQECEDGSAWLEWKYCPNCGAKMIEPQESEEE